MIPIDDLLGIAGCLVCILGGYLYANKTTWKKILGGLLMLVGFAMVGIRFPGQINPNLPIF